MLIHAGYPELLTALFSAIGLGISVWNLSDAYVSRRASRSRSSSDAVRVAADAFVFTERRHCTAQAVLLVSAIMVLFVAPPPPFDLFDIIDHPSHGFEVLALTYAHAAVSALIMWESIADRRLRHHFAVA